MRRLWARTLLAIAALPLPLRIVLFAIAVLHATALSWGMPASDAWDNDGVAPRDFLPGLAQTFTPGEYYTYPPLHLAILAVLTAPITAVAVARAASPTIPDVLEEILSPAYMTPMAMTARILALVMSLGIVVALAKTAEELAPSDRRRPVAVATAIVVGVGVPFTYYSHVSNLDVPYMFWASLGALLLVRAIARRDPRRLRPALAFAALAVTTKDQAFAMFVLALPIALGAWVALSDWARANVRTLAKETIVAGLIAILLVLAIDGALFNPSGFRARMAFLSGSASQDFATYPPGWAGRIAVVVDLARELRRHHPFAIAAFYVVGAASMIRSARSRGRDALAASLVPFAIVVSFSIAFNMSARRVEERFTLPQVLLAGVYGGVGLERAWNLTRGARAVRGVVRVACIGAIGWALFECIELDANLLLEPRYQTETFLARAASSADTIEVHGLNVYLPRFPKGPRAIRVGPTPIARRGPIPGLEEIEGRLSDIDERTPRFVVVSDCYAWRFRRGLSNLGARSTPTTIAREVADADAIEFFDRLFGGRLAYRLVHEARVKSSVFRQTYLHASVGCPVFTFERGGQP